MAKFHVNPATGEPGECSARPGNCPYGADAPHYDSKEAARHAFEESMDLALASITREERWARHGNLDPNTFVSVMTPTSDVLTERFAPDLADDLEPGEYAVFYRDGNADKYAIIKVEKSGEFTLTATKKPTPVSSPVSQETRAKASRLDHDISSLHIEAERNPAMFDSTTAGEIHRELQRSFAKFDWTTAAGATAGKIHLEDVQWALQSDLDVAKRQGLWPTARVLEEANKALNKFFER